jgi:competence protein ComEC
MRLVFIALGWAAGLFAAAALPGIAPLVWLLAFGILAGVAYYVWATGQTDPARQRQSLGGSSGAIPLHVILFALVAFAAGAYRYTFVPQTSDIARYNNLGGVQIEGIIIAEPDLRDDRAQLQIQAETIFTGSATYATSGVVLVNAPRRTDAAYGDRVLATGILVTPAEFDTFSYSDFLARSGVFSVMQNALVEVVHEGEGNPLFAALLDFKAQAQQRIARSLPEPAAALLTGILLGNERGISPAIADAFSRVGASHVIAISGFNMALISGVVMTSLSRFTARKGLAAFLGITFLVIYTLLVGANLAVVRAAFMSSLLIIAPLLKRKTFVPATLAGALIAITALSPGALWDIGFQLSFLATLGLALFAEPLSLRFEALLLRIMPSQAARSVFGLLNEALVAGLAAQILTLPLIILYFQRVSLVTLVVNVLIVPAQALLLYIGLIAVIVALIAPAVGQVVFWLALQPLSWTLWIVRSFAALPYADAAFQVDARLIAAFYGLILGGAMVNAARPAWFVRLATWVRRRIVFNAVILAGFGVLALFIFMTFSRPDGKLHVWFPDIGHGNAALIQTPGGAQMLVDGGRFPARLLTAIGDVLPFYDRQLEVVAITQPDIFDTSALPAVFQRYNAGVILTNGQPNLSEDAALLDAAIAAYPHITAQAGYNVTLDDGVLLEVLHPARAPELEEALDEYALVLRVSYGEVSFLLMGDANPAAQQAMLAEPAGFPLATVMQLPQHGAARSLDADFLAAVQPSVIVAQIDPANRRGDPDASTLELLDGIPLYRTDTQGGIHFWTDGRELWVQTER